MSLIISDLSFSYGSKVLFKQESLGLEFGKTYALVGPNGTGKSTLLKFLAGIDSSYRGEILWDNKDWKSFLPSEKSKIISWVPSQLHSYIDWVVGDFIQQELPYQGFFKKKFLPSDLEQVEKWSTDFEIQYLLTKRLSQLSDGERQRANIVKGLVKSSRIILLDEPSASIDIPHKYFLCRFLQNYSLDDKIVIYSTHDIKMSLEFVDEIIFLYQGKLKKLTLVEFYNDEDVVSWLGDYL